MKINRVVPLMLIPVLVLSACSLPVAKPTEQVNPNAVFTAAAQTVEVQLTQNALLNPTSAPATLAPPTNTAQPTATAGTPAPATSGPGAPTATGGSAAKPTAGCDAAQFVLDVNVPDGTTFSAGTSYTKTWRIKNVGTCTWSTSYALVFDSGDLMGGLTSQPLSGTVAPNQTVDISVNLQAPNADGTFRGYWGLINASGTRIPVAGGTNGKSFYVEIKVGSGTAVAGTEVPGKFAVTSVGFSVDREGTCSSATGRYIVTANITVNKAGNVTYNWVRSDNATGPDMSGTLTFTGAGSQNVAMDWYTTQSGLWVELYIDSPNHQQFGRALLECS